MTGFSQFNGGQGYAGSVGPITGGSEYNATASVFSALLGRIWTFDVVKVISVTNDGGVAPSGLVDLMPLVAQVDGAGNAVPHGVIHGCPYQRVQGGANAVILDPQVGDIGVAAFARRDISSVLANKGQANPGSFRRFDPSDAVYLYSIINAAPTQYVEFSSAGITITSPTAVIVNAPTITLNGAQTVMVRGGQSVTLSSPSIVLDGPLTQGTGPNGGGATMHGPVTVNQDLTAEGTSVHTHVHGGVQPGAADTGVPV